MNDDNTPIQPERVRVSIFERIVPFAAFAIVALGGGVAAVLLKIMMSTWSSMVDGRRNASLVTAAALSLGAVLGLIAIGIAIYRMFAKTATASPSGISYLVLGILSLVPAAIVWRVVALLSAILVLNTGDPSHETFAYWAETYVLAALIATPVILVLLLAFALIPFKATPGRRFGPVISLTVMELFLAVVTVAFMFQIL